MFRVLFLLALTASGVVAEKAYFYTAENCDKPYDAPNKGKVDWSKAAEITDTGCFTRKRDGAAEDARRRAIWMPAAGIKACLTSYVGDDCVGHSKTVPVFSIGYRPTCYTYDEGKDGDAPDGYASYKLVVNGDCEDSATTPMKDMPQW